MKTRSKNSTSRLPCLQLASTSTVQKAVRKKISVLSDIRRAKVRFFTRKTAENPSIGKPGSIIWMNHLANFVEVDEKTVKAWLKKEPSLADPSTTSPTSKSYKKQSPSMSQCQVDVPPIWKRKLEEVLSSVVHMAVNKTLPSQESTASSSTSGNASAGNIEPSLASEIVSPLRIRIARIALDVINASSGNSGMSIQPQPSTSTSCRVKSDDNSLPDLVNLCNMNTNETEMNIPASDEDEKDPLTPENTEAMPTVSSAEERTEQEAIQEMPPSQINQPEENIPLDPEFNANPILPEGDISNSSGTEAETVDSLRNTNTPIINVTDDDATSTASSSSSKLPTLSSSEERTEPKAIQEMPPPQISQPEENIPLDPEFNANPILPEGDISNSSGTEAETVDSLRNTNTPIINVTDDDAASTVSSGSNAQNHPEVQHLGHLDNFRQEAFLQFVESFQTRFDYLNQDFAWIRNVLHSLLSSPTPIIAHAMNTDSTASSSTSTQSHPEVQHLDRLNDFQQDASLLQFMELFHTTFNYLNHDFASIRNVIHSRLRSSNLNNNDKFSNNNM